MVEALVRKGFRRWYERQLIESHAWLAACIVSMIVSAAGIELLGLGEGLAEFASDVMLIVGGMAVGWFAWRRYARTMMAAQFVSEQADCPSCGRCGFRARASGASLRTIDACCVRCTHRWTVALPPL